MPVEMNSRDQLSRGPWEAANKTQTRNTEAKGWKRGGAELRPGWPPTCPTLAAAAFI